MAEARKPPGAGHGTFDLIDRRLFFEELRAEKSAVFLDVGSGKGDYTIALAEAIGSAGCIYALDAWEEGLAQVRERTSRLGLENVRTIAADVNKGIPLPDWSIDICLMATVLHDLLRGEGTGEVALSETARVLKPGGRLAIVEFKKIEDGPGPPLSIRLSEKEVEGVLAPFGFTTERVSDVGPYHYLLIASHQT
jgi:ubiquinone/menaquinone biosynthesis C-methylase UbiE